jgi:phosphotransferase system  glucose/maltose/N-acetylglucosamine-specific IIC component
LPGRNSSFYQRFEHIVILILTALIAVIVVAAVWSLTSQILFGLILTGSFNPSDYTIFQAVFGMIFTVIIASRNRFWWWPSATTASSRCARSS